MKKGIKYALIGIAFLLLLTLAGISEEIMTF